MNEVKELISADIIFDPMKSIESNTLHNPEYDAELARLNTQLEKYTSEADKMDYVLATSSGIICGLLDAFIVGEFSLDNANDIGDKKVEGIV